MKKYRLNDSLIETRHGISKLERDGYTRRDIVDYMYKATPGCSTEQRRQMMDKLFDRTEK